MRSCSRGFIQRIPKYLHLPESSRLILRRGPDGRLTELTVDWAGNPRARSIHAELPGALRALNEVIEISSFTLERWPKFEKARQTQIEIDWVVDKNLPRDARIALP